MASRSSRVLLISLNNPPWFDEMYGPLVAEVRSKADVTRAEDAPSALRFLSEGQPPSAVLVTDEALSLAENAHVWEAVLRYVRQGGTAVVMALFASFVEFDKIRPFFSQAGLDWEAASYHRTTCVLNRAAVGRQLASKLPTTYGPKAVLVRNVEYEHAWYKTNQDSVVQSRVLPPTSAHVVGEAPVALAGVGDGKLGYVGDVNADGESNVVILAMCGLA